MMTETLYYIICGILSILSLWGISMMSKVPSSIRGNLLLSFCMLVGIVLTLVYYKIYDVTTIYAFILVGAVIGAILARRVQMMQMPQTVAMLNGLGGLAGAIVGALTLVGIGVSPIPSQYPLFVNVTAVLAVVVGMVTFVGSMVAAGKLHRLLPQKPIIWKHHELITTVLLIGSVLSVICAFFIDKDFGLLSNVYFILAISLFFGSAFGLTFAIRVGGADMPITISLLTSLAGVAAAIAGMAISDLVVVSIGGIVGSSGLLLTQIMCKAMNRSLIVILTGKTAVAATTKPEKKEKEIPSAVAKESTSNTLDEIIRQAKTAIIVPGYGMALAQAQHQVRQLADMLETQGTKVRYAVHPVAGRMPGHMNVLLAEADVAYDQLYEMDSINDDFKDTDLVVVIGANDVLNPAARDAEGTPIYGMPVLNVDQAKHIVICNYDTSPGYAGVPNPLYEMSDKVTLLLGDAKESLNKLMQESQKSDSEVLEETSNNSLGNILHQVKTAIIVPGYGMALAQAQHQVRQLADLLESQGTKVRYAVHPVAGRMPGHMNVLLAEADVAYDQLYEMDSINDDFKDTDLVVVIGANDVLNPAARDAEGTPIYGMPVLNVDQAKHIVICNYDTSPGYAGVPNPLYEMSDKVTLLLGDAKESLNKLMQELREPEVKVPEEIKSNDLGDILHQTNTAIIVPGYGMALAQAQHQVRQLADLLESQGTKVRYAVHPVAGRMPGHMNVLLAEADVAYDQLYEMDSINDDFKDTDLVVVIGANDVLNPAARDAEGTPIYGMPVLNVDQAKHIVICNYDTSPGYAGVPNPLYEMPDKVTLLLGDAKESLNRLMQEMNNK